MIEGTVCDAISVAKRVAVRDMISASLVHRVGNWQPGNAGPIVRRAFTRRIMAVRSVIIPVGTVQVRY